MCRLTAYFGHSTLAADVVTRPTRSVIRQSFDARERLGGSGGQVYDLGNLNADGFGLGWYSQDDADDVTPCVFTEVGPAWHNRNLHRLACKVRSSVIFAHVRAAGPGMGVCHCSCHPFEYGRFLFMHNGQVAGYKKIRRELMDTLSQCAYDFCIANSASDSALAFALFIDQLDDPHAEISPQHMKKKLTKVIQALSDALERHNVNETSLLNFVVTDGNSLAATRYVINRTKNVPAASLYFSSGTSFEPSLSPAEFPDMPEGKKCPAVLQEPLREYRMVHEDRRDDVVIITSEPLTNVRADWIPVPKNHIVLVTPLRQVLLAPVMLEGETNASVKYAASELNEVLEQFGHDRAGVPRASNGSVPVLSRSPSGTPRSPNGTMDIPPSLGFSGRTSGLENAFLTPRTYNDLGFEVSDASRRTIEIMTHLPIKVNNLFDRTRGMAGEAELGEHKGLSPASEKPFTGLQVQIDDSFKAPETQEMSSPGKSISFLDHMKKVIRFESLRGGMGEAHGKGCPPGCGCNPGSSFLAGLHAVTSSSSSSSNPRKVPLNTKRAKDLSLTPADSREDGDRQDVGGQPEVSPKTAGREAALMNQTWAKSYMSRPAERPSMQTPARYPIHVLNSGSESSVIAVCMKSKFAFSSDGGETGAISVYDVETWQFLNRTSPQNGCILALCLAETGPWLLSSVSNNSLLVWDASQPAQGLNIRCKIRCPSVGHILSLAVTSDGLLLLGSQDATVRCATFDLRDRCPLREAQMRCEGEGAGESGGKKKGDVLQFVLREMSEEEEEEEERKRCGEVTTGQKQDNQGREAGACARTIRHCRIEQHCSKSDVGKQPHAASLECQALSEASVTRVSSHCGFVFGVVSCGDFICSGGGDGRVKLWRKSTLRFIKTLAGHRGAVMAVVADSSSSSLFSGATDGAIRVWDLDLLVCKRTLPGKSDVLALAVTPSVLLAGYASGFLHIINRSSYSVLQTLSAGGGPVHCVSVEERLSVIVCGTDGGRIVSWNVPDLRRARKEQTSSSLMDRNAAGKEGKEKDEKEEEATLSQPDASKLPMEVLEALGIGVGSKRKNADKGEEEARTRSAEDDIGGGGVGGSLSARKKFRFHESDVEDDELTFYNLLRDFVSLPSISSSRYLQEDCWHAARFVATTLEFLGAQVKLVAPSGKHPRLPCVLAKFACNVKPQEAREEGNAGERAGESKEEVHEGGGSESVLVYGHYDVAFAEPSNWDSDPFTLTGRDGYLYGRGVSDNKGPLLASMFAVKKLLERGELTVDVTFVIEGEEESGLSLSERGLEEVIVDHMHWFGNCRAIIISNNYWIDDHRPCLTYGMRGVIDFEVWVTGPSKDLHSGVDGGAVNEPMHDLTALIASLTDQQGRLAVEELLVGLQPVSEEEERRYSALQLDIDSYCKSIGVAKLRTEDRKAILKSRWSEPWISVSSIETTNRSQVFRKIPKAVVGRLSLHFVPKQEIGQLQEALKRHLHACFRQRNSANSLSVVFLQASGWWLGNTDHGIFRQAAKAVSEVWGVEPILVREGGSYGGVTTFLEQTLKAPAIHLPMGQASDNAHLPNERIRILNLRKGQQIMEKLLAQF